jgi:hypothetical protein
LGKHRGLVLCVLTIGNLRIRNKSVLLTIGNGVSGLATIAANRFNYTLISVKALAKKYMSGQILLMLYTMLVPMLKSGLKPAASQSKHLGLSK